MSDKALFNYNLSQLCKEHFIDNLFIVSTTKYVERLFSVCRYELSDYRNKLLPDNFEAKLLSDAKRKPWSIYEVNNSTESDYWEVIVFDNTQSKFK